MPTNPHEFRPVDIHLNHGLTLNGELGISFARQVDALIEKGENNVSKGELDQQSFANEARLYQALINGPHGQNGWKTHEQPMHRLEEINQPTARVIRSQCADYPLTNRIIAYGEDKHIEWWQTRYPWQLTEDELYSDPKYIVLYDAAVARGECTARVPRQAPDGTEPGPDDRIAWVKAVNAAIMPNFANYPLRRQLGYLITGLKNFSLPVTDAVALAFTGSEQEDGIAIERRLANLAEVVPELGRLVSWIEARQKAA